MKSKTESAKLVVKDGWLMCPACKRQRVLRITEDTRAKCLPVYCKRCGRESIVNIDKRLSL